MAQEGDVLVLFLASLLQVAQKPLHSPGEQQHAVDRVLDAEHQAPGPAQDTHGSSE